MFLDLVTPPTTPGSCITEPTLKPAFDGSACDQGSDPELSWAIGRLIQYGQQFLQDVVITTLEPKLQPSAPQWRWPWSWQRMRHICSARSKVTSKSDHTLISDLSVALEVISKSESSLAVPSALHPWVCQELRQQLGIALEILQSQGLLERSERVSKQFSRPEALASVKTAGTLSSRTVSLRGFRPTKGERDVLVMKSQRLFSETGLVWKDIPGAYVALRQAPIELASSSHQKPGKPLLVTLRLSLAQLLGVSWKVEGVFRRDATNRIASVPIAGSFRLVDD